MVGLRLWAIGAGVALRRGALSDAKGPLMRIPPLVQGTVAMERRRQVWGRLFLVVSAAALVALTTGVAGSRASAAPAFAPDLIARPAVTKPQAIATVRQLLRKNAGPCGYRIVGLTAKQVAKTWRVAAALRFTADGRRATAAWSRRRAAAPRRRLSGRDQRASC